MGIFVRQVAFQISVRICQHTLSAESIAKNYPPPYIGLASEALCMGARGFASNPLRFLRPLHQLRVMGVQVSQKLF